ncbi:MAG: EamA family transporter [Candidatus Borkfalkiaceae bacterium]|nr:EamA family transporter [Christensenellaceae bacterium]
MWFVLSLVALLCWSGSDLFSKIGSKPDDKYSQWKMVVAVGLVMGIHAAFEIFVNGVQINWSAILTYLPASALYISSMILGYIALRYIELSVSSPVCNSSGAIASLFMIIFFFKMSGIETQGQLVGTIFGIVACGIGVVGLGFAEMGEDEEVKLKRQEKANVKYSKSWIAIVLPVLYCFIDAGGTIADTFILETLDENVANVAYELTFLACGGVAAIYVFAIKRDKPTVKREAPKLIGAVCETAGQFAYIMALAQNSVAAAPIVCCYCALSVVWGAIFLKERLSWKHYLTIAITIAGIVLLGVFGGD